MHLKDTFLEAADAPEPEPEHHSAATMREALRGIGDPMQRDTTDFVMSFGASGEGVRHDWKVGDSVEYLTPDGQKRHGSLARQQGDAEWLVEIDDNTYNVVPSEKLRVASTEGRGDKRLVVQKVLATTDEWTERCQPEQIGEFDFRATIDYGHLNKVPSDDSVCAYIAREHDGHVLDAVQKIGGKLDVYFTTRKAEVPAPSDPTSTDQPGLEDEEMEGTGKVAYVAESLKRFATMNTNYDVVTNQIVEDEISATATFRLQASNGDRLFVTRQGNVTPVMSADAVEAVGYIAYDGADLTGAICTLDGDMPLTSYGLNVQAGIEAPYSSGDGALGTRTDEPEAEDGSYVVKADAEGPATEEDGEVREEIAGPGEVTAVDKNTKEYYKNYYGKGQDNYGEMLVRDIVAAWIINQDREPTREEMDGTLQVLASFGAEAAMPKEAQVVSVRDFIQQLMEAGQADDSVKSKMDKMLAGYISSNPTQVLDKLDATAYPRTLYMMLQDPSKGYARKLQKLHGAAVDLAEHVKAPSADEWGKGEGGEQADDLGDKRTLMERGKDLMRKVLPGDRAVDKAMEEAEALEQAEMAQGQQQPPKAAPADAGPIPRHDLVKDLSNPSPGVKPKRPELVKDLKTPAPGAEPKAAAKLPPAKGDMGAMHPRIEKMTGQGSYMCIEVVWDPECCEGLSPGNVRHQLISWLKGCESMKEYRDMGTLGKPRFKVFDPDLGLATMQVRSTEAKNLPQEVSHQDENGDASA